MPTLHQTLRRLLRESGRDGDAEEIGLDSREFRIQNILMPDSPDLDLATEFMNSLDPSDRERMRELCRWMKSLDAPANSKAPATASKEAPGGPYDLSPSERTRRARQMDFYMNQRGVKR